MKVFMYKNQGRHGKMSFTQYCLDGIHFNLIIIGDWYKAVAGLRNEVLDLWIPLDVALFGDFQACNDPSHAQREDEHFDHVLLEKRLEVLEFCRNCTEAKIFPSNIDLVYQAPMAFYGGFYGYYDQRAEKFVENPFQAASRPEA